MRRSYNSGRTYKSITGNDGNLARLLRLVAMTITSIFGADAIGKYLHRLLEHYYERLGDRLAGVRICRVYLLIDLPDYLWNFHQERKPRYVRGSIAVKVKLTILVVSPTCMRWTCPLDITGDVESTRVTSISAQANPTEVSCYCVLGVWLTGFVSSKLMSIFFCPTLMFFILPRYLRLVVVLYSVLLRPTSPDYPAFSS